MSDILEFCQRRSGRTTEIVNICCDHLQVGDKMLVVVAHNTSICNYIQEEIHTQLPQVTRSGYMNFELYGKRGMVKIITMDKLEGLMRGSSIKDILFDTPEVDLFGSKFLGDYIVQQERQQSYNPHFSLSIQPMGMSVAPTLTMSPGSLYVNVGP
jgi:hypothetical protein